MSVLVTTETLTLQTRNNTGAPSAFAANGARNQNPAPSNISKVSMRTLIGPWFTGLIGIAVMGWWGRKDHIQTVGYISSNATTVQAQLDNLQSRGADLMAMAWYGQGHESDAAFAMWKTKTEADAQPMLIALLPDRAVLDKGTGSAESNLNTHLVYAATQYFGSAKYYKVGGRPVMFFFMTKTDYDRVTTAGWERIRTNVKNVGNGNPLFYFQDKRGFGTPATDLPSTDGGYAWGVANELSYYTDFYKATKTAASIAQGKAVWADANPGFDDQLASWGKNRIIDHRAGNRWMDTWALIDKYYADGVRSLQGILIPTYNDFEEGSAMETGIENSLVITPTIEGNILTWTATFSDPDGHEQTVSSYRVFLSLDGENLGQGGSSSFSITAEKRLDLATLGLDSGTYQVRVQAVGQPSITNKMSAAVEWFYDTTVPLPTPDPTPSVPAVTGQVRVPAAVLAPPPHEVPMFGKDGMITPQWRVWLNIFYRKIGSASDTAPINISGDSDNITGLLDASKQITSQLKTANLVPGAAVNITNDGVCDSVAVDATNTTVQVHGSGGASAVWNVYLNSELLIAGIAATAFTGKSYATTYYVGYNLLVPANPWSISTSYRDITGDYTIRFSVRTRDSQGVAGSAEDGGGGTGDGGFGGGGYGIYR